MPRRHNVRAAFSDGAITALKQARREKHRREKDRFQISRLVPIIKSMAIARVHREWRLRLLHMPDNRTLTAILMGDPRYERSALYAKRMGWI